MRFVGYKILVGFLFLALVQVGVYAQQSDELQRFPLKQGDSNYAVLKALTLQTGYYLPKHIIAKENSTHIAPNMIVNKSIYSTETGSEFAINAGISLQNMPYSDYSLTRLNRDEILFWGGKTKKSIMTEKTVRVHVLTEGVYGWTKVPTFEKKTVYEKINGGSIYNLASNSWRKVLEVPCLENNIKHFAINIGKNRILIRGGTFINGESKEKTFLGGRILDFDKHTCEKIASAKSTFYSYTTYMGNSNIVFMNNNGEGHIYNESSQTWENLSVFSSNLTDNASSGEVIKVFSLKEQQVSFWVSKTTDTKDFILTYSLITGQWRKKTLSKDLKFIPLGEYVQDSVKISPYRMVMLGRDGMYEVVYNLDKTTIKQVIRRKSSLSFELNRNFDELSQVRLKSKREQFKFDIIVQMLLLEDLDPSTTVSISSVVNIFLSQNTTPTEQLIYVQNKFLASNRNFSRPGEDQINPTMEVELQRWKSKFLQLADSAQSFLQPFKVDSEIFDGDDMLADVFNYYLKNVDVSPVLKLHLLDVLTLGISDSNLSFYNSVVPERLERLGLSNVEDVFEKWDPEAQDAYLMILTHLIDYISRHNVLTLDLQNSLLALDDRLDNLAKTSARRDFNLLELREIVSQLREILGRRVMRHESIENRHDSLGKMLGYLGRQIEYFTR